MELLLPLLLSDDPHVKILTLLHVLVVVVVVVIVIIIVVMVVSFAGDTRGHYSTRSSSGSSSRTIRRRNAI